MNTKKTAPHAAKKTVKRAPAPAAPTVLFDRSKVTNAVQATNMDEIEHIYPTIALDTMSAREFVAWMITNNRLGYNNMVKGAAAYFGVIKINGGEAKE